MKLRFPNGEAGMKVNIYDFIRVPGRSTFRDSSTNAQVTVNTKQEVAKDTPQAMAPSPLTSVPPLPAPKATPTRHRNAIKQRQQMLGQRRTHDCH